MRPELFSAFTKLNPRPPTRPDAGPHGKRGRILPRASRPIIEAIESRLMLSASMISSVNPGTPVNQGPATSVTIGNEVYFAGNDGTHGVELWKSDGTTVGTMMVDDINPGAGSSNPANLTNEYGILYFTANDGVHGTELWKSNGTAAGTVMVADINPGAGSSNPASLTVLNGTIYFSANDGVHGSELWESDGTAAGTSMVMDINPGAASSNPTNLVAAPSPNYRIFQDALYFIATGSDGTRELWLTFLGQVHQLTTGLTNVSDPTLYNNLVYFAADDGVHGTELWSGAYFQQAKMFDDINPGSASSDPNGLYVFDNDLYFSANGQMWKTDGTLQNTVEFTGEAKFAGARFTPLYYVSKGDSLYIINYDSFGDGKELWQTDGTIAGTNVIASLDYYTPQAFATESEVYFVASETLNQPEELYQTDGTAAGTKLADPDETTAGWYTPTILGAAGNTLLFGANKPAGETLWGLPIPSAASAAFVKTDTATQGTWEGVYGSQGYVTPSGGYPPGIQFSTEDATGFDWTNNTNDPRALQVDNPRDPNPTRAADCWYGYTPFSLDFNFTDGGTHQTALYLLDWDRLGRSETIQISDATTGNILSTQTVSNFQNGTWLVYNLSGAVKITFINDGPVNAVVSGVFFDPAHAQAPAAATEIATNTTLGGDWRNTYGNGGYQIYSSGATDLSSSLSISESGESFYDWQTNATDPRALRSSRTSPNSVAGCVYSYGSFSINLGFNDGLAHQLALYLVDYDYRGRSETVQINDANTGALLDSQVVSNFGGGEYLVYNVSGNIKITVTNDPGSLNAVLSGLFIDPVQRAAATAEFIKTDSTTIGTYTGVYGSDGYDVVNASVNLPSYAKIYNVSGTAYTWDSNTSQLNALQDSPGSTTRIAACDYEQYPHMGFNLDLTDGKTHQVALYVLDWDSQHRAETIQITDTYTGKLLDSENVSNFTSGKYLVWDLSGDVQFEVSNAGGLNEVMSGLFFDPANNPPAQFKGINTTTQGTWNNVYGSQGYDVVNAGESLPGYATLSFAPNATPFTWAANTSDPRALQDQPGSGARIASCYYSSSPSFSFNLNLSGTQPHPVELYFLDWDNLGRSETVQVSNAATGAVLDTETVSNFSGGKYLLWNLSGNLNITITNTGGLNEVLSGVFFG